MLWLFDLLLRKVRRVTSQQVASLRRRRTWSRTWQRLSMHTSLQSLQERNMFELCNLPEMCQLLYDICTVWWMQKLHLQSTRSLICMACAPMCKKCDNLTCFCKSSTCSTCYKNYCHECDVTFKCSVCRSTQCKDAEGVQKLVGNLETWKCARNVYRSRTNGSWRFLGTFLGHLLILYVAMCFVSPSVPLGSERWWNEQCNACWVEWTSSNAAEFYLSNWTGVLDVLILHSFAHYVQQFQLTSSHQVGTVMQSERYPRLCRK